MFNNLSEESHKWKKLVIININFISIKLLYLYIFDSFCQKKLVDIDHRGWTYFFCGRPCSYDFRSAMFNLFEP